MAEEKHIIRKAIVEIHVPNAGSAAELQSKALIYFKEKICPLIEKIIARYSTTGQTIRIDKLELDLKNFRPGDVSDKALLELEQEIENKISKIISEETQERTGGTKQRKARQISGEQSELELFICLLKTGTLPWWAGSEKITLQELAEKVLAKDSGLLRKELVPVLSVPAARTRLVRALSDSSIEIVISKLFKKPDLVLGNFRNTTALQAGPQFTRRMKEFVCEFIFSHPHAAAFEFQTFLVMFLTAQKDFLLVEQIYLAMSSGGAGNRPDESVYKALAETDDFFSGKVKELFSKEDKDNYFKEKDTGSILEENENDEGKRSEGRKKEEEEREEKKIREGEHKDISEIAERQKSQENKNQRRKTSKGKEKTGDEDFDLSAEMNNESGFIDADPEGISPLSHGEAPDYFEEDPAGSGDYFVRNAGLILLAPYLPVLLRELGLCKENTFVSEQTRERAVFLVQHLSSGMDEGFEEHEMVLAKLLCGMEITAPLTQPFAISDKEKEECLGLLDAVAGNWTALRGTSGVAMREAFFGRDGVLEQQGNGWNLSIERTTIDVLLDKLPWGISILQMPWSSEMIFVTW
ncbi:MAG: contractile injection system tape measure protein [Bacteroidia bacterium]